MQHLRIPFGGRLRQWTRREARCQSTHRRIFPINRHGSPVIQRRWRWQNKCSCKTLTSGKQLIKWGLILLSVTMWRRISEIAKGTACHTSTNQWGFRRSKRKTRRRKIIPYTLRITKLSISTSMHQEDEEAQQESSCLRTFSTSSCPPTKRNTWSQRD